jgi:hypothetical protein
MWIYKEIKLNPESSKYAFFNEKEEPVSFADFFAGLSEYSRSRSIVLDALNSCLYLGMRWEFPAMTFNKLNDPCEFVLINCPALLRKPANSSAFKKYFKRGVNVVSFPNLGGDSTLVVCQINVKDEYAHLKSYLSQANEEQTHDFLKTISFEFLKKVNKSKSPLWLNTAGLGVSWLHMRIDTRPKYYWHKPYKLL